MPGPLRVHQIPLQNIILQHRGDPHSPFTRVQLEHECREYLRANGLAGQYKVVCDEKNNPIELQQKNLLFVEFLAVDQKTLAREERS